MLVFSESAVANPKDIASRLGIDFLVTEDSLARIGASDRERTRILWIRFTSIVTEEILSSFKSLEVIVTTTTGLTHLAMPEIRRRGIDVVSLSHPNTSAIENVSATAEHAWSLIQDSQYPALNRSCIWSSRESSIVHFERSRQLLGQTLGIVGFGRLGRKVATYGIAFGMRVIALEPRPEPKSSSPNVQFVDDLRWLISEADVVSLHASYQEGSSPIITDSILQPGKPELVLVNTARAELVDEKAILLALEENRLSVYAADVFEGDFDETAGGELKRSWSENIHGSRFRLTPHVAGACLESYSLVEEVLISRLRSTLLAKNFLT